jgi:hypothetical protein
MSVKTIWLVADNNDSMPRMFYFPTLGKATEFARAQDRAAKAEERFIDPCSVESVRVETTREGIAQALNDHISMVCGNEG